MNRTGTLHNPKWLELDGEAFVRQAYQRLLDRPVDPAGLQNYLARLGDGMSKAQVVAELENSPEGRMVARRRSRGARPAPPSPGQGRERTGHAPTGDRHPSGYAISQLLLLDGDDFVREAYWAILGREADPTGLAYYGRRIAAGESKEQVLVDLRTDPEGRVRDLQVAGLDELVDRIQGSPATGVAPVKASTAADLMTLHGREFIQSAYLTLFGRAADTDGLTRYLELMRSGWSRSFILSALADSPEGTGRAAGVTGLPQLLAAYRKGQGRNWAGWYWRNVRGAESDLPAAREIRRIGWREEG